jgi:hypothetical protein
VHRVPVKEHEIGGACRTHEDMKSTCDIFVRKRERNRP